MIRKVVEDALGSRDARELWTVAYRPALPGSPADFVLEAVLPSVLYMMRWGHRRGKGRFFDVYGQEPTIEQVAGQLSEDRQHFCGFEGDAEQAILGDLLLTFCLENRGHKLGRNERVQRVFPVHYLSSWIDLPRTSANLRGVPETVVAILAQQPSGPTVSRSTAGHYAVGAGFDGNLLLRLFGSGVSIPGQADRSSGVPVRGQADNLSSDRFDETATLGIDQLLMVRVAQSLGEAPLPLRGEKPEIPNQHPAARRAADAFHEDLNVFMRAFGGRIPRQSLLPMLESCLSVGLTNIYLSTLPLLLAWVDTGAVPSKPDQRSWPLFVDCSASVDATLRRVSEECMDDLMQRLARLPVILMCLRILDQRARHEGLDLPSPEPDPTARLDMLGDVLHDRLPESRDIMRDIRKTCIKLGEALEEAVVDHAQMILKDNAVVPCWCLAEALVMLMGDPLQLKLHRIYLDACLMMGQPNGLGRKRKSTVRGKMADRRSIVLPNTVLDFLVHRHLRKARKGTGPATLSLARFIDILRDRYGFHVSEAPPGMAIPADLLRRNRTFLEQRLRDLGLLIGVNDAESMKRLRPRYQVEGTDDD